MEITADSITALKRGVAFLAAGGGGEIVAALQARRAIEECGPVALLDAAELDPDALIMPIADMGAPMIFLEKISAGTEGRQLREAVERSFGRPVDAMMAAAIGGSNGLTPVMWAARNGLPLVDADTIGRAFPELYMTTFEMAGVPSNPSFLADERGNAAVLRVQDGRWLERLARSLCIEFGGSCGFAGWVTTAATVVEHAITGTYRQALAIGEALESATEDPVAELCAHTGAVALITGKISEIERRIEGGFVLGTLVIEGTGDDAGRIVRLEFQNEFLAVLEQGEPIVTVPDVISVVDPNTADSMSTERVRYGARCVVVALESPPQWTTQQGIDTVGPRAFGYEFDYRPVGGGDAVGR